jgi:hypothetical protein
VGLAALDPPYEVYEDDFYQSRFAFNVTAAK